MSNDFWTVNEAAKYLRMGTSTLYQLSAQRKVPYIKLGGRKFFRKADLDLYIEESVVWPNGK